MIVFTSNTGFALPGKLRLLLLGARPWPIGRGDHVVRSSVRFYTSAALS